MNTNIQLTSEELNLTQKLMDKIKSAITTSKTKSISFAQYMQMALYDAEFGYYNNTRNKIGQHGDFTTAPNISGLFGLCISEQIKELWQNQVTNNILEFGAGNGQLMLDLLCELGNLINHYYVIDVSPSLKNLQQDLIKTNCPQFFNKVIWLNALPNNFDGIILANELLDAMPCELIKFESHQITSQQVTLNTDNQLDFKDQELNSELSILTNEIAPLIPAYAMPYISEINLNNRGFIKTISSFLNCGVILLIDYGHAQKSYYHPQKSKGTLRGFFRQQLFDNTLLLPGLMDITCNVNFSSIYSTAIDNGLKLCGYTHQAGFLINCGLLNILDNSKKHISDKAYLVLSNQANRLTSTNHMGEIFKVIAFSKNIKFHCWKGFSQFDLSGTL